MTPLQPQVADGGPALPCEARSAGMSDGVRYYGPWAGLSLRDYFAAKAMVGLMGRAWDGTAPSILIETWTRMSFRIADAMLAARTPGGAP